MLRGKFLKMKQKHKILRSLTAVVLALAMLPVSMAMADTTASPTIDWSNPNRAPGDISSVVKLDDGSSSVTVKDSSGKEIKPGSDGNYENVPDDAAIALHYAFSLLDDNGKDSSDADYQEYSYKTGDTYTVKLPAGLSYDLTKVPSGGIPVKDGDGVQMGTLNLSTDSGVTSATVTFTDYVESHSAMTGWFEIDGTFTSGQISSGNPVTVTFNSTAITLTPQKPDEPTLGISKSGNYDSASNEITWTVKVTPAHGSFKNVSVTDVYGDNQTYVAGSFERNGTSVSDGSLTLLDTASRTLTYTFPDSVSSAQVLTYKTKPKADAFDAKGSETPFDNTANLTATLKTDGDTTATADATVSVKPDWIDKSAGTYNNTDKTLPWTIHAGIASQTISGAEIVDTLPDGLELNTGSVKWTDPAGTVHPLTKVSSSSPGYGEFYYSGSEMICNIGDADGKLTGRGTLTYTTAVSGDPTLNHNGSISYDNTAQLVWNNNSTSDAPSSTGTGTVGSGGLISKWADGAKNYDNTNPLIHWTIQVNRNQITMPAGTTVTDTIPAGQEYYADEAHKFSISPTDNGSGSPSVADGNQSFTYTFTGGFSKTYTIQYYTKVTDPSSLYKNGDVGFSNSVTLQRDGETDVTTGGTQTFHSQVIAKSAPAGYDYNTHEVTWQIAVNRNNLLLTDAAVTDTLPAGMEYVSGSFQVDGNPKTPILSGSTVSYQFPALIQEQHIITLKTKLTDAALQSQFFHKTFSNTASLTSKEITTPVSSQASVTVDNPVVTKTAQYTDGNDYVNWVMEVNKGQLSMNAGAALTDKLQSSLSLERDSVQIYPAAVSAADGTLTAGSTPLSPNDYTVTYVTDQSKPDFNQVTFTFKNPIKGAYLLSFTTDIVDPTQEIQNQITFSGSGVSGGQTSSSQTISVSRLQAGGSGTSGSITVHKTDVGGNPLAGATFQLYKIDKTTPQGVPQTTGADGTITFSNLPFHTFYLVETQAPSGYVKDGTEYRVRPDSANPSPVIPVINEKAPHSGGGGSGGGGTVPVEQTYSITVTKTNEAGQPLSGAEFTLYGANGSAVATAVSNAQGLAVFSNVAKGAYTIRETKAPAGYQLDGRSIGALVNDTVSNAFTVADKVQQVPGAVRIHKTDEAGKPLSGAEFTLYGANGAAAGKAVTGTDGVASFGSLPAGTYTVFETRAPSGYTAVDGGVKAAVASGKTADLTIRDRKISAASGSLQVKKADRDGNALAGAEFTLYSSSGSVLRKSISGPDGIAVFSGLNPGSYSVRETKAPDGYQLFGEPLNVSLGSGKALAYTLRDNKNGEHDVLGWSSGGTLPKTGGVPWDLLALAAGLSLILLGIGFGIRSRRKRKADL